MSGSQVTKLVPIALQFACLTLVSHFSALIRRHRTCLFAEARGGSLRGIAVQAALSELSHFREGYRSKSMAKAIAVLHDTQATLRAL